MKILLIGGHQKARFLTKSLKAKNYDVKVINEDPNWCKMLADEYEVETVWGSGTSPNILKEAGADRMDIVVALDSKDSSNLLICEIAKKQFHVKKTFAAVNDVKNIALFQNLGVDRCVSVTRLLTDIIEQETITSSIDKYLPVADGKVVVCEVSIDDDSMVQNKKLWEIALPPQSIIGCIIREEQTMIPQGSTELKAGDKAIVLSSAESAEDVTAILSGKKKK